MDSLDELMQSRQKRIKEIEIIDKLLDKQIEREISSGDFDKFHQLLIDLDSEFEIKEDKLAQCIKKLELCKRIYSNNDSLESDKLIIHLGTLR